MVDLARAMTQGLTPARVSKLTDEELHAEVWNQLSDTPTDELADLDAVARAFFTTMLFEREVANGGLHQFFLNQPDRALHEAIVDGYKTLELQHQAELVKSVILPAAEAEREWRTSLASDMSSFLNGRNESVLTGMDDLVGTHDLARCALIRSHPDAFTRELS